MSAPSPSTRITLLLVVVIAVAVLELQAEHTFIGSLQRRLVEVREGRRIVTATQTDGGNIHDDINKTRNAHNAFDYTAFWEDALKVALESRRKEKPPARLPCPKVYVYDLHSNLTDSPESSVKHVFGETLKLKKDKDKAFRDYLRDTNQYSFPSILEYRLKTSKECRTFNPKQADLFFAPVMTGPKKGSQWRKSCQKVSGDMVHEALVHLNSTNACRHFLAMGKGHYNGKSCEGWWSNPKRELVPFMRLSYSHFDFDKKKKGRHFRKSFDETQSMYPNLFSVPYPSSIHFHANGANSSTEVSQQQEEVLNASSRDALMLFLGKSGHGDTQVRKQLLKFCEELDDEKVCKSTNWKPDHATIKSQATFCLEPAGDSPWRKSLSDSITFGCIPVLFSDLSDDVAPWFWQDWKARGRVLVPRDDFVAGRIDLKKLLQSMPPELLKLMQMTLREKARRFQYSIDEDMEDGIGVVLRGLYREALDMERRGVCGY